MVTLLETRKTPAYLRVAQTLLESIESGIYAIGTLLPSERAIAKEFKVSTMVANQALNLLADRGVIDKVPRKGSFVRSATASAPHPIRKKKIVIHGANSPKDINERVKEFTRLLSDEFPQIDFEYLGAAQSAGKRNAIPAPDCDIIISGEKMFANFAVEGGISPLNDLKQSIDFDEFYPQPFEICDFGGDLMGVPLNFNPSVLYCNMEILEKAGISQNALATLSWDRFIEICAVLKEGNPAVFPLGYFEYTSCWWENFFYTHGVDIIIKERFETDIFTQPGLDAIKVMKRLIDSGLAEDLTIRRDALSLLSNDRIAFVICNPRILMEMTNRVSWFLTRIPRKGKSVSAANSFILSLNAESKQQETAKEVMLFMLSEKFQDWLGAAQSIAPARKSSLRKNYSSPNHSAVSAAAETARMLPNQPSYWDIHDEIGKAARKLLSGVDDIERMEYEINEKMYLAHRESGAMELLGIA